MENDVLKNKIAPYLDKGRWYKFTFISDGTNWISVPGECDLSTSVTSAGNLTGVSFNRVNSIAIVNEANNNVATSSAVMTYFKARLYKTSGSAGYRININPATPYEIDSKMTIYVHGILM